MAKSKAPEQPLAMMTSFGAHAVMQWEREGGKQEVERQGFCGQRSSAAGYRAGPYVLSVSSKAVTKVGRDSLTGLGYA
jgi:hypothetical protein